MNLNENLEYDRMLFYYDRQCGSFNDGSHKDDNEDFTHKDSGLIDESRFLSIAPYTNDERFHEENNWSIESGIGFCDLAIGGI